MSLFSDYQMAINSLAEERRHKDQIGYQNWQQSESNRQGALKGLTNAAMGAALMYAFPPAGLTGALATGGGKLALGAGLGYMGGGSGIAIPYIMNKGGTPTPTKGDMGSGYDNIINNAPKPILGAPYTEIGYDNIINNAPKPILGAPYTEIGLSWQDRITRAMGKYGRP